MNQAKASQTVAKSSNAGTQALRGTVLAFILLAMPIFASAQVPGKAPTVYLAPVPLATAQRAAQNHG